MQNARLGRGRSGVNSPTPYHSADFVQKQAKRRKKGRLGITPNPP